MKTKKKFSLRFDKIGNSTRTFSNGSEIYWVKLNPEDNSFKITSLTSNTVVMQGISASRQGVIKMINRHLISLLGTDNPIALPNKNIGRSKV